MSTSPSYDKYATITSSSSNVRSVSPMRTNALYKEPESDYCKRCAKYIYPLELMGPVMGHRYHKLCFRCHACERLLDFKNYRTNLIDLNDREIYCTAHNPRNGAFNDNIYGYNARSKSPGNVATTNDGVNEYSSSAEYYKVQQQHKSSENLDRTPYTPTYTVASNGNGGYVNLTNDYSTYEPQPLGYRTAYSKSSEKLLQESSVTSSTSHQHHRHEVSSSSMSSTTVGGSGVGIVPIPTATINIPPVATVGTNTSFYLTNNSSGNNIQCLPSSNLGGLSNERYQYESNRYKTDSGSRNIVVDVITHDGDDDNDRIDSYDNYKYPTVDEHQYNQYNHNNQQYNTSDAITGTTSSYGGTYYDTNSKNYNLKSIISEAMSHDKSHQWQPEAPKRYHYPTSAGSSYDRTDSTGSSGSSHQNSNLKSIFAEASMAAAIRSSESRSSSVSTPSTPKDFPSNAGNLKNVYIDALNEHHRTSSGSASTTTYEGKDANLKQIYNEASHAAAQPNRGVLEDRTNNMKHIINEAAITNALAEKVAHNSSYSNDAYYPQQQQPYVVSGGSPASITKTSTIEQHHHHQYSSSSTTVQHQTYHSSSSGNVTAVGPWTSSQSTNSPIISRPAINNQITIPVESDSDRKSNLVNIVNDVIATNNSAYSTYPNRFNFTGPNANLKGIVAEAIDYNSRNAPSNQNMYHNLKDSRPLEMDLSDMNQNNIIGENKGYGLARITVHYDQLRSRFSVTVHEARYLRNLDKKSVSDPYARVYLAPDGKPSYKRKTRIIKNNLNPVWQETFDYPISLNDALNKVLTVNLKDERGFFEKQEGQFLGEVVIPLRSVDNISSPFTRWYFLQPLNSTPNILATAGSNIKSF